MIDKTYFFGGLIAFKWILKAEMDWNTLFDYEVFGMLTSAPKITDDNDDDDD